MSKIERKNIVYTIIVLSFVFMLAGIISFRYKGLNPYGAGTIFISVFLFAQYLKFQQIILKDLITILTWISVFGFLIVDVIIIWNRFF